MTNMFLRPLAIALGFIFLGLGILGAFLPLLPTTPFVLLASYFFSKGSPHFYQRLLSMPCIGKLIGEWNKHGVIRRRAKVLAVTSLLTIALYLWFRPVPLEVKFVTYAIFIGAASFVVSRPEK